MSMGSKSLPPPTAEQKRRWRLMEPFGCITAHMRGQGWRHGEIHHLTVGGKHGAPRLGHDFTIRLSQWAHRGVLLPGYSEDEMERDFGPSYAKTPKAFRREFGSDEHLLKYQNELIGWTAEPVRERNRKHRATTRSFKTLAHQPSAEAPQGAQSGTGLINKLPLIKQPSRRSKGNTARPDKIFPRMEAV